MEKGFEEKYHKIEKEHFWFKSRRNYIRKLLAKYPKDATILDIGCSSGILLDELKQDGFAVENLYGVDISSIAIENCKKNGIPNAYVMDAQHIELRQKFDIVIASDCLEHIEDDKSALKNWNNLLTNQGTIMIFVPAFMSLWSHHDKVNMHYRRYTLPELKNKMEHTGFKIKKSSFWNFFLFVPVYLFRKIESTAKKTENNTDGDLIDKPFGNYFLTQLINFENKLLQVLNFPFGISVFCIAKKNMALHPTKDE
ncbi:class I SAM-dependent methyltransferase [Rasiella sp. SM2506]|uniref:class I SAM-dependent methyltransferase n=1 Tax=Rasiella sp. SM2506 TaxID=3423914 RepID=UPI003D799748